MDFQTQNFIEIIDSEQGVQFLREDIKSAVILRFYEGKKGLVVIDCSEEYITDTQGNGYLKQLGLDDLIPAMFPKDEVVESASIEKKEIVKETPDKE